MSLVALNFSETRLLGIIPSLPSSFTEINLRFYVKRLVNDELRRGVVFIREIVPSRIITSIARVMYNEPYTTLRTERREDGPHISDSWGSGPNLYQVRCERQGEIKTLNAGSAEDFILERYWGYTAQPNGSTVEYRVSHAPWRYWELSSFNRQGDLSELYGEHFRATFDRGPHSVFLAEGSIAKVSMPRRFFVPLGSERPLGWILYDGRCGLCSTLANRWSRRAESIGFACASNNSEWVLQKMSPARDRFTKEVCLLLRDGGTLYGVDVYLFLMSRIWWLKPLGFLLGLPGVRHFTIWLYTQIARRRHLLSQACGLKSSHE